MPQSDAFRPVPGGFGAELLALADRCVQCGLCLPHCPTYRLDAAETESPRGRIAYMKAVASGALAPTALGDLHLDHCLACRRCEGVCPAEVEYGRLLVMGRKARFERDPPRLLARFRLGLLARPRALSALLGLYRALFDVLPRSWRRPLPRPPASAEPAPATGEMAVFVGCLARRYEAPVRTALLRLGAAAGMSIGEPTAQGCCGAAAAHAGDHAQAGSLAGANRAGFADGRPVLCTASGCQPTLAQSLAGVAPVEDALVALAARADRLRFRPATGRRVALHLPCTQQALPGSARAMRELLARVPGLELVPLPDTGCCGGAGMHQLEFPERASRLRAPLLEAIRACGAVEVLSASHSCRLHLAGGSLVPIRHPLELLAEFLA
jgi:glycolate oxidase iron-sulfur subunit